MLADSTESLKGNQVMPKKAPKTKEPKRVVLDKPFAGIPQGSILYVATPAIIAAYIQKLAPGERRSIEQMRRDLAKRNKADATCPVSTAIFIRSVAEVSLRLMAEGSGADKVVPFWRLVAPGTPIAKRLDLDADWLVGQLAAERPETAP
jgi:hypothetical protein